MTRAGKGEVTEIERTAISTSIISKLYASDLMVGEHSGFKIRIRGRGGGGQPSFHRKKWYATNLKKIKNSWKYQIKLKKNCEKSRKYQKNYLKMFSNGLLSNFGAFLRLIWSKSAQTVSIFFLSIWKSVSPFPTFLQEKGVLPTLSPPNLAIPHCIPLKGANLSPIGMYILGPIRWLT
jgi:hypothetical protein